MSGREGYDMSGAIPQARLSIALALRGSPDGFSAAMQRHAAMSATTAVQECRSCSMSSCWRRRSTSKVTRAFGSGASIGNRKVPLDHS